MQISEFICRYELNTKTGAQKFHVRSIDTTINTANLILWYHDILTHPLGSDSVVDELELVFVPCL